MFKQNNVKITQHSDENKHFTVMKKLSTANIRKNRIVKQTQQLNNIALSRSTQWVKKQDTLYLCR